MTKKPTCKIMNVVFLVFFVAITLSFGGTFEGRSSYYLVTSTKSCILSKSLEEYNAHSEVECMSLCNNKDGCSKGVYGRDGGSCLLEITNCKLTNQRLKTRGALISAEKHFLQFSKLGRTFDFKERKFRASPHSVCYSTTPFSCKEIYETDRSAKSGVYSVFPEGENSTKVEVYCHMTEIPGCGKGGWTLVMKIDGTKDTFRYDSHFWSSKVSFQPSSALNGLDHSEALSPAYWATPMNKLCLGMEQKSERGMAIRWIVVPYAHAQTLHSLIADGGHRFTPLRREDWLSLMTNSTIGLACPNQGLNLTKDGHKVRIGMIAGKSCKSPMRASLIGFGTTGNYSCGNIKGDDASGVKHMPSFGYILVQ